MEQDNLDMEEQDILQEEEEKAFKKEESAKKLKAILFIMLPLLIAFLIFTHYFLKTIEANKVG